MLIEIYIFLLLKEKAFLENQLHLLQQTIAVTADSNARTEIATLMLRDVISSMIVETKQMKLTVVSLLRISFHFSFKETTKVINLFSI